MDAWLNKNVETEEYRERVRSVALGLGDLRACELADLEKALNLEEWPYLARIRFSKAWDDLQRAEDTDDDDDDLTVPYVDKSERRPKKKQMTLREYDAWVTANASAGTPSRRRRRPTRDAPRRFIHLVDSGKSYVERTEKPRKRRSAYGPCRRRASRAAGRGRKPPSNGAKSKKTTTGAEATDAALHFNARVARRRRENGCTSKMISRIRTYVQTKRIRSGLQPALRRAPRVRGVRRRLGRWFRDDVVQNAVGRHRAALDPPFS